MRRTLIPAALILLPAPACAQLRKDLNSPPRAAGDLERRDGMIDDPQIGAWLQQILNRLAASAGLRTVEPRITKSVLRYALPAPPRLYISVTLLKRTENEAELAGLLAHHLAHLQGSSPCVMSPGRPMGRDLRESERLAISAAVTILKSAGFDPAGALDILSKLAYENPEWGKAIVREDLLELRLSLETDAIPPAGYRIDSSEFLRQHSRLAGLD